MARFPEIIHRGYASFLRCVRKSLEGRHLTEQSAADHSPLYTTRNDAGQPYIFRVATLRDAFCLLFSLPRRLWRRVMIFREVDRKNENSGMRRLLLCSLLHKPAPRCPATSMSTKKCVKMAPTTFLSQPPERLLCVFHGVVLPRRITRRDLPGDLPIAVCKRTRSVYSGTRKH